MTLTSSGIDQFIEQGFVRVDGAFSRAVANDACAVLDRAAGCDHADPATWKEPVVRLGGFDDPPFIAAANTPRLRRAFDQLVGAGRWTPRTSLGGFVLRFPVPGPVTDDGWHIDTSFPDSSSPPDDYFNWRANLASRDRILLMLFLFTDVGESDAPTRIRIGSHLSMARRLAPAGEAGLTLRQLAKTGFDDTADLPEALATGEAGTVWLCHPFLVHAAQAHKGRRARYLGQPPLHPKEQIQLERADGAYSPVERAIRAAMATQGTPAS